LSGRTKSHADENSWEYIFPSHAGRFSLYLCVSLSDRDERANNLMMLFRKSEVNAFYLRSPRARRSKRTKTVAASLFISKPRINKIRRGVQISRSAYIYPLGAADGAGKQNCAGERSQEAPPSSFWHRTRRVRPKCLYSARERGVTKISHQLAMIRLAITPRRPLIAGRAR
jgi:hypothetical protein